MLEELLEHLAAARADEELRVLVLSSTDHMGLSAGADVREELDARARSAGCSSSPTSTTSLTGFPKPTIAACHGACVGGGAEIAVACDLRVGGSNLRMRFPGAGLGVPVGPARLVTLCGLAAAKYLLLTSRRSAPTRRCGWASSTGSRRPPRTEEAALELAAEVAAHPPEAVARLKPMLHAWDGVEERSRAEGEGQVEWQSEGPGPRLPVD